VDGSLHKAMKYTHKIWEQPVQQTCMYTFVCDEVWLVFGVEATGVTQIRPVVAVGDTVLLQCALRCKAALTDDTFEWFLTWPTEESTW